MHYTTIKRRILMKSSKQRNARTLKNTEFVSYTKSMLLPLKVTLADYKIC